VRAVDVERAGQVPGMQVRTPMPLGRVLGLCAVPLALVAAAIGVVLLLDGSTVAGAVFLFVGGDLLLAGVWMLATGRPRSLPFRAARPGSRPGTDWSSFPDLR
jgi:hypothetical protein